MTYMIRHTQVKPDLKGLWDGPVWARANTLSITHFHPQSTDHHPLVQAKVLYDDQAIHVHFKVQDQYVRCVNTKPNSSVCHDSCVEFFFRPAGATGYLNLEANACGVFLCSYIENHRRAPGGFEKFTMVDPALLEAIKVYHSLPWNGGTEIAEPTCWQLEYTLPLSLIERYAGPLGPLAGQTWRANFYKCGDRTSKPHWAAWADIGSVLNFHLPEQFAEIRFEADSGTRPA